MQFDERFNNQHLPKKKSQATTQCNRFSPNLVRQLLPHAKRQLKKIMVVDGDALSSLVDPAYSHFRLPGNIQTEKDTEDAFKTTFLDGINGILRYEQARQELQRASSRTLRHEDILDNIVRNMSPSTDQTYSSSPRRTASTSDFAHFNRTRVLDSQLAPICIEELKTPKAFDAFEYLLENICAESPALKDVEGWAVRFVWPEENSAFHDHKMSKGSLVLAQVWADMVDTNEKQFGILSSGERSYFLRRNRTVDEFKGTLFISLLCAVTDFPFLTIYSWVAHSLSQLPVPPNFVLETPIVNQVWYQDIPLTPGHYGIDHKTLPPKAMRWLQRQRRQQQHGQQQHGYLIGSDADRSAFSVQLLL